MTGILHRIGILLSGIVFACLAADPSALPSADAYDTFEHRYLGNTAYDIVSKSQKLKEPPWATSESPKDDEQNHARGMAIRFLNGVPVMFGDLPALAGDYTESVDDLSMRFEGFRDVRSEEVNRIIAIRRQWFNACRWHHEHIQKGNQPNTLDQCFPKITREQLEKVLLEADQSNAQLGSEGYSPTRMERGEFERLPEFIDLAAENKAHFPQHSWSTYIQHHYCALVFAAASGHGSGPVDDKCKRIFSPGQEKGDSLSKEDLLRQAIIYEGFAHHFLHDSFSSGHIGVPYGWCAIDRLPPLFPKQISKPMPMFCSPTKQLLQHTHDTLNRLGIKVAIPNPPMFLGEFREKLVNGWTAFGDNHLFIPEAAFHRAVLLRIAVESLEEVYKTATGEQAAQTFIHNCMKWKEVFPVPAKQKDVPAYTCQEDAKPNDLWKWGLSGRSADERVPDPALEGWKIMVTHGQAFGRFNQLNADGSVKEAKNSFDTYTFELGYIRSTGSIFNYFGFGIEVLPEIRTSIYPLSFGGWYAPPSRLWFFGLRSNIGVRLEEGLTEENPENRLRAQFEGSLVIDAGFEIYAPVAFYIRAEPLSVVARGFGSTTQTKQATVESPFNGRGAISFVGLRFDLADIF